jgi:hypothetical protein
MRNVHGLGATETNPCACQWPVAGVTPIPGLPNCDPSTGGAPGCTQQEVDVPFCSGIPYGQPGYVQCLEATEQAYSVEEPQAAQAIATFIPTLPASVVAASTPASPTPASSTPATTGSSTSTPVSTSTPTVTASSTDLSATPVSSSDPITDWLTETQVDGIPNWALLAGGLLVVWLIMESSGGRRR